MISILLHSEEKNELKALEACAKHLSARLSEDDWDYHCIMQLLEFLQKKPMLDIACIDVAAADGIDGAKKARELNRDSVIMLVADASVSPTLYITPDILAASLLLRPYTTTQMQHTLAAVIQAFLSRFEQTDRLENSFLIDNRDGRQYIPFERILYFEAFDKKILVVTDTTEYSFYDTLDSLEEKLPQQFIRCHRSFIVNGNKIEKMMLSRSTILLESGDEVSLSRSYKGSLKEIAKERTRGPA